MPELKISHATTKIQSSQINKERKANIIKRKKHQSFPDDFDFTHVLDCWFVFFFLSRNDSLVCNAFFLCALIFLNMQFYIDEII